MSRYVKSLIFIIIQNIYNINICSSIGTSLRSFDANELLRQFDRGTGFDYKKQFKEYYVHDIPKYILVLIKSSGVLPFPVKGHEVLRSIDIYDYEGYNDFIGKIDDSEGEDHGHDHDYEETNDHDYDYDDENHHDHDDEDDYDYTLIKISSQDCSTDSWRSQFIYIICYSSSSWVIILIVIHWIFLLIIFKIAFSISIFKTLHIGKKKK